MTIAKSIHLIAIIAIPYGVLDACYLTVAVMKTYTKNLKSKTIKWIVLED